MNKFFLLLILVAAPALAAVVWDNPPIALGGEECSLYAKSVAVIDPDGVGVEKAYLWAEDRKGAKLITKCGLRPSLDGSAWLKSENSAAPCRLKVELHRRYRVGVTVKYMDGGAPHLWETSEIKEMNTNDCK